MAYWGGWRRQHEQFQGQAENHRSKLGRDTGFFDGAVLYVGELRMTNPFRDELPHGFSVLSIGLGGDAGSVKCSAATHAEWQAAGLAYVDAVVAATARAAVARERFDAESEKLRNRVLRWRRRQAERDWAQAVQAYRTEVNAAEEAYRPTREAVAAAVAAQREEDDRMMAALQAQAEERRGKARELASLPLWGIVLKGKRGGVATVHRHDVAPRRPLPTDTRPHQWEEAEPLTGFALEPALRALRESGASVRWEPAAKAAVEEEFGHSLQTWWEDLFPESELFRPRRKHGGSSSSYTGTSHHSSYGVGGFSCASVH